MIAWVFLSLTLLGCALGEHVNVTVDSPAGTFIGFKENVTVDGSVVELSKFFGIPYAEPPIGDLRFRKPISKAILKEPMVVQEHGTECIQIVLFGESIPTSEDCLFLNIYAPENPVNEDKLAVMIWIHGGGFFSGSSNAYVSDLLSTRGNVVVVTINYRLSILGFLNAEHNGPSNFGLWDQHMAIKWVHDNIEAFGGDNGRVTIFGESAGAGSVIYQGIYPGNRGLFQRIIAESGTASAPWGISLNPKAEAEEFASLVGCKTDSVYEMMDCLRKLPAAVINDTLNDFSNGLYRDPVPFLPSSDNEFCTINAKSVLNVDVDGANGARSVFASFDLMMGVNAAEGGDFAIPMFGVDGDINNFLPNRTYFEDVLLPICIKSNFGKEAPDVLTEALRSVYTAWKDPENPIVIRDNFVDMWGDNQFLAPVAQTIDLYAHESRKDPYMYFFTATPSRRFLGTATWLDRPNHGDELVYVFGEVIDFSDYGITGEFQEWEKELSKNMMILWTNFAKTGNPNTPRAIEVDWQPYTSSHHRYLEIAKELNHTVTKERLHEQRVNLWNNFLPSIKEAVTTKHCETNTSTSGGSHTAICSEISLLKFWIVVLLSTIFRKQFLTGN